MKKIVIEVIPHSKQRYPTLGDYWIDDNGDWQIRISDMCDQRSIVAVALHELFEMGSVVHKGIPIESIDAFDIMFEKERAEGKHPEDAEPGHDKRAPYWEDHFSSEAIERHFLTHNGMMWDHHAENCDKVS